MTISNEKLDVLWDDNPIDVSSDANFIWGIANKLRGVYMPDKYGDVVIPMTIIRRFECALSATKNAVVEQYKKNPEYPVKAMYRVAGFQFYNVSEYTLEKLLDDPDNIASNFKAYIDGFSANVRDILNGLEIDAQIKKMDEGGCLYNTIKDFSELDLSIKTVDPIRMGYIFENLIGRFFQNVDAGQFYTGRDIIKTLVSVLISEGCDDIFDDHKVITICDQACGTGGMLSTAYSYLKHYNPTADIRLYGQEYMAVSYAVGLAEMLIKGQDAENFRHTDTFKEDCFKDTKMRFVIENPPFGTPWSGKDAKAGQEEAVKKEFSKGENGRWGAGLPGGGDSQLIFMQSAIDKMDDHLGRAAIIENGSPLFTGGTSSGESQIRRWMLEQDLIEAIIALPTDLFYNTGIATYVWILSKNKREERKGKIQLIDCTSEKFYKKLRKSVGNKRNEISPQNRKAITKLYTDFKENEYCKIYDNEEFIYREYTVMQPLQRSYAITKERIDNMLSKGCLSSLYDEAKVYEYENSTEKLSDKDQKKLDTFISNKPIYDTIVNTLKENISDKVYLKLSEFEPFIAKVLNGQDKKIISKITYGLSLMDKNAEIQKDKKGNIFWDKETKDTEIVKWQENIDDYMAREVLPHIPDAKAFFEGKNENASFDDDRDEKTVKIGAEIPFTSYFYMYVAPESSDELLKEFIELDKSVNERIARLVK
ncbi:MAG: type I restriction-modification system subunit M [Acholeplasmatales bacterium]|nr:type I restriction-modification system subunit M [Acholeplasmatales bacterium]